MNGIDLSSEQYQVELKKRRKRGLCTMTYFDETLQGWVWCPNLQHERGRKGKCRNCLAQSTNENERLIAQNYCKCKLDHPPGRGCPYRFLHEIRFDKITDDQAAWCWRRFVTFDGKLDFEYTGVREHFEKFPESILEMDWRPISIEDFDLFVWDRLHTSKVTRLECDLLIFWGVKYHKMWTDSTLNLPKRVKEELSKKIKQGMGGVRQKGVSVGRPQKIRKEQGKSS